ncbi:MAG: sensor domain-containing diguanylate cyclase [Chloroflexota bacterium]
MNIYVTLVFVAIIIYLVFLLIAMRQRERRYSVLNRSNAIITSSMDVPRVFKNLVQELKKVVDIGWAAVVLAEDNRLNFLALSGESDLDWKVGEHIPIEGTATEQVVAHQKTIVKADLFTGSRLSMEDSFLKHGMHSIAYLPLITKGRTIGSFILASRRQNAYDRQQITLLEHLAVQMATPIENARLYAAIEEKARIDDLTGLLNRRSLDELLASEISRHSRYGGVFSLVILDLDSFKTFNDTNGHLAGDKLLGKIGGVIKNTIRGADRAFRYGGDEFAIVLPNTPINAAIRVAERARKQVAAQTAGGPTPVTTSLGVSAWPADGTTANEVIAAADTALYEAKRSGKNRSQSTLDKPPKQ